MLRRLGFEQWLSAFDEGISRGAAALLLGLGFALSSSAPVLANAADGSTAAAGRSAFDLLAAEGRSQLHGAYLATRSSLDPDRLPKPLRQRLTLRVSWRVPKAQLMPLAALQAALGAPEETLEEELEYLSLHLSQPVGAAEVTSYRYGRLWFHVTAGESAISQVSIREPWMASPPSLAPESGDTEVSGLAAHQRFWALRDLVLSLGPRAEPTVLDALDDQDLHVRRHACLLLGRLRGEAVVSHLLASLEDPELSRFAAVSLARIGDPRGAAALARWVGDFIDGKTRGELRRLIWQDFNLFVDALGLIGGAEASDALLKVLRSRFASELLTRPLADLRPAPVDELIEVLGDKQWKTRMYAAAALGWIGDAAATGPLQNAAKDKKGHVKEAAQTALERFERYDPGAVPEWRIELQCRHTIGRAIGCEWYVGGDIFDVPDVSCLLANHPVSAVGEESRILMDRQTTGFVSVRGLTFVEIVPEQEFSKTAARESLERQEALAAYCRW